MGAGEVSSRLRAVGLFIAHSTVGVGGLNTGGAVARTRCPRQADWVAQRI